MICTLASTKKIYTFVVRVEVTSAFEVLIPI